MFVVNNKFDLGQIVYLATDEDQTPRMVTFIKILPGGLLVYELTQGNLSSLHFEIEITADQNIEV